MSRRIFRNSFLGTATSANWNVTYRPWRTILAPILISFSRNAVSDQCPTSVGDANGRGRETGSIVHNDYRAFSCSRRANAIA